METSTDLRYPVGKYEPKPFSTNQKEEWIADIKFLPNLLEAAISNLDGAQLQTPYREGGWTVHQVVHHVADSHMNAYIRFKLGMTEENPTIKPYEEKDWAVLEDVRQLPVNISITLLFALHERWTVFLKSIPDEAWETRTVFHPEHQQKLTLWFLLGMYAWHSRHHTAHITALRERMGW
ncbi:putative metal-dependent hydrolase [Flaviaesturariibacter flavus]|uniref:Putative metal-dependent hydrolase n=1 Tax=Flaviaesturariibacter flavus TaxID=2502780 RepID=A0A4R1BPJ1_9BACT|nr:putative metal-dependent hydrolase [Flaviaesturariibacter flavus]TCJ19135.1 putative metal-dependent hydrolase [Flaviaesturariibacter flavus]